MKNNDGFKTRWWVLPVVIICFKLLTQLPYEDIKLKFTNSTDLSNISCGGAHISDVFENTDNYTTSTQDDVVKYANCQVGFDENNIITFFHADFRDMNISINSDTYFKNIDDIIEILGTNYTSSWYDREQQLKQVVYVDHENNIKATFVYNTYENELIWLILEGF